jgi:hypothetical protein
MKLKTSLPDKKKKIKTLPLPQKIFDIVRETEIELPVLLSMRLSYSMSGLRGIKKTDIVDGLLTLNRTVVDVKGKSIEKDEMKEYERTRQHVVPQYLMDLINKCEGKYVITLTGQSIYTCKTRYPTYYFSQSTSCQCVSDAPA